MSGEIELVLFEIYAIALDLKKKGDHVQRATIGTLRYQDEKLGRRWHWKSKTGTSPVLPAKHKILKWVVLGTLRS